MATVMQRGAPPGAEAASAIDAGGAGNNDNDNNNGNGNATILSSPTEIDKQITRGVLRAKLSKHRHLVLPRAISPSYLDGLMPPIVKGEGGGSSTPRW